MTNPPVSHAALCHRYVVRVIAILIAFAGCGGAIDVTATGAPAASGSDCPSIHDIDTKAAVGEACSAEGTYCLNPACDSCAASCPAVACTRGVWTVAANTALCSEKRDASVADAALCIEIDPASFDQACNVDSDCFQIAGGKFCSGGPWCMCGIAAINVADKTVYESEIQDLQTRLKPGPGVCSCPYFGTPRCVANHCTLCGGAAGHPPGCPDGG